MEVLEWAALSVEIWTTLQNVVGDFQRKKVLCGDKLLEAFTGKKLLIGTQRKNWGIVWEVLGFPFLEAGGKWTHWPHSNLEMVSTLRFGHISGLVTFPFVSAFLNTLGLLYRQMVWLQNSGTSQSPCGLSSFVAYSKMMKFRNTKTC